LGGETPNLGHNETVPLVRLAAVALAALAIAPAAPSAAPATATAIPASGLYGFVRRGPTTPVCQIGKPCSAPAVVTLAFTRDGREVARTRSRANGAYRVALAPGTYAVHTVRAAPSPPFAGMRPTRVRVPADEFRRQDFSIDTGIR
jgi:hypothetical protein